MSNTERFLTYKQAMQYLGITSYSTFTRNYLKLVLPVIVLGKSRQIDREDIDQFVNRHKTVVKKEMK